MSGKAAALQIFCRVSACSGARLRRERSELKRQAAKNHALVRSIELKSLADSFRPVLRIELTKQASPGDSFQITSSPLHGCSGEEGVAKMACQSFVSSEPEGSIHAICARRPAHHIVQTRETQCKTVGKIFLVKEIFHPCPD